MYSEISDLKGGLTSHLVSWSRGLELIVLRPGELFMRNDAVLVLVLVTKDLLYEFVLIRLHLVGLICLGSTCGPDLLDLLFEVSGKLLPVDVIVNVRVNIFKHIDGRGPFLGIDELNIEDERSTTGDHITGALIAVRQLGRYSKFP